MALPTLFQVQLAAMQRGMGSVREIVAAFWPEAILDTHQIAIIDTIIRGLWGEYCELAVKGCTGAGKGCAVSMAVNLWFEAHPEAKVILSSTSAAHAKDVIFSEVVMWRRKMRGASPAEILEARIRATEKHWVIIANPDKGEGFSGFHGGKILSVFDESSSCSEKYWNLTKTHSDMRVAISNPRSSSSWFFRLFPEKGRDDANVDTTTTGGFKRKCVTVSGADCLNVKTGKKLIPGQITKEIYDEIISNPEESFREMFGYGRFPREDVECALILPSWLPRHIEAHAKEGRAIKVTSVGLDVADSEHGDWTVMAVGGEEGVGGYAKRRKTGTMETVSWCISVARDRFGLDLVNGSIPITVDADGVGKGVADRLAELGSWIIPNHGSGIAFNKRAFINRRAEVYGILARRLSPMEANDPFAIPDLPELIEDILAPEKIFDSDGIRFKLQPKDLPAGATAPKNHRGETVQTIKQKLGRSPDHGDATAYLSWSVFVLSGGLQDAPPESQVVQDDEFLVWAPGGDDEPATESDIDEWDDYFKLLADITGEDEDGDGDYSIEQNVPNVLPHWARPPA